MSAVIPLRSRLLGKRSSREVLAEVLRTPPPGGLDHAGVAARFLLLQSLQALPAEAAAWDVAEALRPALRAAVEAHRWPLVHSGILVLVADVRGVTVPTEPHAPPPPAAADADTCPPAAAAANAPTPSEDPCSSPT